MSKIFRLYKSGSKNIEGWMTSKVYGTQEINEIKDTAATKRVKDPTSIPSPFARIDLMRQAFLNVNNGFNVDDPVDKQRDSFLHNAEGQVSWSHQMVSDFFDVCQILFNYDTFSRIIEIREWDIESGKQNLMSSGNKFHQIVGSSLSAYLQSDASSYHFDRIDKFYIIGYTGSNYTKTGFDVIAATSPATLFFTSANSLSYLSKDFNLGADNAFDEDPKSLIDRDPDFIEYMFALRKCPEFSENFKEVTEFLDNVQSILAASGKNNLIPRITNVDIDNYDDITCGANVVYLFSDANGIAFPLKKRRAIAKPHTDMQIKPSRNVAEPKLPLVLPSEASNKNAGLYYVTSNWDIQSAAPAYDPEKDLFKRILPFAGCQWPYLTIDDLLSNRLIQLDNEFGAKVNSDNYLTLTVNGMDGESFLLPLTTTFFKYFGYEDLESGKMITAERLAGGCIRVTLSIPIEGNGNGRRVIEYRKVYQIYNKDANYGAQDNVYVTWGYFCLATAPCIKFTNPEDAIYRVSLLHNTNNDFHYSLRFIDTDGKVITNATLKDRHKGSNNNKRHAVYGVEGKSIEAVQIYDENSNVSGFVVLKNWQQNMNREYMFAMDFGTSNTHIEYCEISGGTMGEKKAFDITEEDKQMQPLLLDNDTTALFQMDYDMIPGEIGKEFCFPVPTTLSAAAELNWATAMPIADSNFPVVYGKRKAFPYNVQFTNLKWRKDADNNDRLCHYMSSLLFLVRNKVILNGGRLDSTRVIWFYPTSMTEYRVRLIGNVWEKAKKAFLPKAPEFKSIPESCAPYFSDNKSSKTITIDIGGGTTDIAIAVPEGNTTRIKYISSFRYAANAVVGDGYERPNDSNSKSGIVRTFEPCICESLVAMGVKSDILEMFKQFSRGTSSSDSASFLFSLAGNTNLTSVRDRVDLIKLIDQDDSQKLTVLMFYVSIIYHLGEMLKKVEGDGVGLPRHIIFSGNGSKLLNSISNSAMLEKLTKIILVKRFGLSEYDSDGLDLKIAEDPKGVTGMGGLNYLDNRNEFDTDSIKKIYVDSGGSIRGHQDIKFKDISDINKLDEVHRVEEFIDFFFNINDSGAFSFRDKLGISQKAIDVARGCVKKDLKTFINNGIQVAMDGETPEDFVTESMFFYPLVGVLHNLSIKLYEAQTQH